MQKQKAQLAKKKPEKAQLFGC